MIVRMYAIYHSYDRSELITRVFKTHFLTILLLKFHLSACEHFTTSLQYSRSSKVLLSSTSARQVPLLSSASPTPSIHLFLGLPTGLLPCGFHSKYLLASLSSSIRLTCPNHLNLLSSTSFRMGFTERRLREEEPA